MHVLVADDQRRALRALYAMLLRGERMLDRMRLRWLSPTEHADQCVVIQWWALACHGYGLPEYALFAVPNAGRRSPFQGKWMKDEGLRRGMPDLLLPVARKGFNGLAIEMKSVNGRVTGEQTEVLEWFLQQGWRVWVCHTSGSAIEALKGYLG